MKFDPRKKIKRYKMMRLNTFESQEIREIGRKEAGDFHLVDENNK